MKLKVCGMKYEDNIHEVAALEPDYMGFIFYKNSPRYCDRRLPEISESIKRVGIFVNASLEDILIKVKSHDLKVIQLHGNESPEFCEALKAHFISKGQSIVLWKVFGIKETFDFEILNPYVGIVNAFLFDTKGRKPGGNSYVFNWELLKDYPLQTPFILSGGIGLDEVENVKTILGTHLPIYAIDVNSKFEEEPGLKNPEKIKQFINELSYRS